MSRWWLPAIAIALVAGPAGPAARAALPFMPPSKQPARMWAGTAPGRPEGVLLIRSRVEWDRVTAGLDPAYAGEMPDFGRERVLLVIGRERENPCRSSVLKEVSVRGGEARVSIEERVPAAGCDCPGNPLPPLAWLVSVPRSVVRASRSITDVVEPCEGARETARRAETRPVLLLEASWDEPPGARLLVTPEQVAATARRLGKELPAIDPARERLVLVTGRPRSNGCRRTRVVETAVEGTTARFVVEERYPARGEACAMLFQLPAVFVYRVPASVEKVVVEVREAQDASSRK